MTDNRFAIQDAIAFAEDFASRTSILLYDFIERWFDECTPSEELIYDVNHRYNLMVTHLHSIADTMGQCLLYLQAADGNEQAAENITVTAQQIEEILEASKAG